MRALDEAAERAVERGAHSAAAKALERAASLSADRAARAGRLARAASLSSLIGRDAQALGLAERARALTDDPALVAQCAFVLGVATLRRGRPRDAIPALIAAASSVASHDAARAAELLMQATSAAWQSADGSAVQEIARITKTVVPPDGDPNVAVLPRRDPRLRRDDGR